jgi:N-acetylglutamate synthase-like GNAT family acetyltransferase
VVLDDGQGDDTVVGCGALKQLDPNHAEVKSMRTSPARARSGIASLLLDHIITPKPGASDQNPVIMRSSTS